MKLIPTKQQFKKWSLIGKAGYIGALVTIFSAILTLFSLILQTVNTNNKSELESLTIVKDSIIIDSVHKILFPRVIDYSLKSKPLIKRINKTLKDTAMSILSRFLDWEFAYVDYKLTYNKDYLLSILFTADYYAPMAAHSVSKDITFNINNTTGFSFELKDLFRANYKENLNEILVKKLKDKGLYFECSEFDTSFPESELLKQILLVDDLSILNTCFDGIRDDHSFLINDKGVCVVFCEYEIGPYSAGRIHIDVSFKEIESFINPNGPLYYVK